MIDIIRKMHKWNWTNFYWTENRLYIEEQNTHEELTYDCDLITAYILYKAIEKIGNFDWCATDDEVMELVEYISDNANKHIMSKCNYSISIVDEINQRMKIVGCSNFIDKYDKRAIINDSIEQPVSVGLVKGFNKIIRRSMDNRKEEIPPILTKIDMRCGSDSLEEFLRTLRKITEEYEIIDNKIYKYVRDV